MVGDGSSYIYGNQSPFGLWSCWDRAANSFGARPPRQVCGRQPKSRREYPPSRWKVPRNWVTDRRRRHSGPAPAARRKGRVSNDAMPASEKPTTGRSAMLLHSLQSALLFGVFETARLIGRLGTPLLFLGELSGRQSRRLSPVEPCRVRRERR